jgi:ATP-dependent exoDNAse (exonuclease V) beta subunit
MSSLVRHEFIRASAGTGKTYQLVNRYLRLLFLTGAPERIIALTFTRKAAGEFFEKIFQRLAEAAENPEKARVLSREIETEADSAACLSLLRLLLNRLNRLQLSTYDSFFARIVRSFPFELGLSSVPSLLGEAQKTEAMLRTQAVLLQVGEDDVALREFWHAFKLATMGREEKRMSELLDSYIAEHQSLYLNAPEKELWGIAEHIWNGPCPWAEPGTKVEASGFRALLPWHDLSAQQKEDWEKFLVALDEWNPPSEMPDPLRKFVEKFLAALPSLRLGEATIMVRRKMVLTGDLCALAARLAVFGFWAELAPRLQATQGVYQMLRLFEAVYRDEVRGLGLLTMEDMTRLLSGEINGGRGLADPEFRMKLDYRLDGSFDHWLLDEFQDTSRSQWKAIESLVDEVLQDSSEQRSFFAVGDSKQSLYLWRGSDDRLFDLIQSRYGPVIDVRKLDQSYRSAQAVLDMVNGVFDSSEALGEVVGETLARRWQGMWSPHRSASPLKDLAGHACWLQVPEEDEDRRETLLYLLRSLKPLERGLSVAILTQTNGEAEEIVDYLRSNSEIPCSLASEVSPGTDNPASVTLRSLVSLAAHPSDIIAWTHLCMSPLAEKLFGLGEKPDQASAALREILSLGGTLALVRKWKQWVLACVDPQDVFTRMRIEQCIQAARDFDESGVLDIDLFLRELDEFRVREVDVPGQVAVMTIHKSKGLDWDLVLLPDLEGKSLSERRRGMSVKKDEEGGVQWVLQMPRKEMAGADPILAEQIEEAGQDAAFEQLCLLYVAMTRAKRGLYLLTHPCGKSKSLNFVRLLEQSLGTAARTVQIGEGSFDCAWEAGNASWIESCKEKALPDEFKEPELPRLPPLGAASAIAPVIPRSAPSRLVSKTASEVEGNAPFSWPLERAGRIGEGLALHQALAGISWLPEHPAERAAFVETLCRDLAAETAAVLRASLADESVAETLKRPSGACELWLEKEFDVSLPSSRFSGRMDRVVIERDDRGLALAATIIDYKTGNPHDAQRYASQFSAYRQALSCLSGLPEEKIRCLLIWLSSSKPGVRKL